jgi:hypothetical protein
MGGWAGKVSKTKKNETEWGWGENKVPKEKKQR